MISEISSFYNVESNDKADVNCNNYILTRQTEAKAYIKAITGADDTKVTFALFPDKDKNLEAEIFYGSLSELWNILSNLNDKGYGVFMNVQETFSKKRKTEDIGKTRSLFIDLDVPGEQPEYHLDPSFVVSTSPGKYHSYWLLEEPEKYSKEEFNGYLDKLIGHYKSDKHCKDLVRVMRLPGFYHHKDKPFLVTIVKNTGKKYTKEEVLNLPNNSQSIDTLSIPIAEHSKPQSVPSINEEYKEALKSKCQSVITEIGKLAEGKRNNTINKKCYQVGGYLAHTPELIIWFKAEFEANLDKWIKTKGWGSREKTLETVANALEAGSKNPLKLEQKNNNASASKPSKHTSLKSHILDWLKEVGDVEWNEMGLCLELNREPIEAETMRQMFLDDIWWVDAPKEMFRDIVVYLGKQNFYHPVREYLENLSATLDESALNTLYEAMGVNNPLHKLLIRKFLIACVARALRPGIKHDNVLVLKGKQGTGKTTFFETLFSKEFFQTLGKHRTEADEIMALTSTWCSEYGELETALGYKSVSEMKNFLTRNFDIYRPPYGEKQIKTPRSFAIVGTTNQDTFLSDSTGNRRFWVVEIFETINNAKVEAIRDDVWAIAKTLFLAGEAHYLDRKDDEFLAEQNVSNYETEDLLTPDILRLAKTREWISIKWLAEELKLPVERKTDMRISDILRKNKCTRERKTINSEKCVYWRFNQHWDERYKEIEASRQKEENKKINKEVLIRSAFLDISTKDTENNAAEHIVICGEDNTVDILSTESEIISDMCERVVSKHRETLNKEGVDRLIIRDGNTNGELIVKSFSLISEAEKKEITECVAYIESTMKSK
ncbi:hypothetical protein H6G41_32485 [Tolypothrix sp. FACHB-123]|uniref:VapE domain-containing protein n=1 Tax=Tolypothrix sp. FACHB-123 TaxID=2692868 RepID=UPI001682F749|nr:VapE domain-containing protein [Tolypothrix sp. FACHB-123]MBD2359250.1 hypothetical protein [Tolypothrix sp. FACHB-123]